MTKLEFLKGMKKLANYFLKDLSDEELTSWYEIFKDIEVETFYMSIQEIGKSNKYFPVLSELYEECRKQRKEFFLSILENNKSISENRLGYLKSMVDWYSIQKEYPKEIIKEVLSYKKSNLIEKKGTPLIG